MRGAASGGLWHYQSTPTPCVLILFRSELLLLLRWVKYREVPGQTRLCLWASRERKGQLQGAAGGLQVSTEDGTLRPQITLHLHGLGANTETAAPSQPRGNNFQQRVGDFFRNINFMACPSPSASLLLASFSEESRQKLGLYSPVLLRTPFPSLAMLLWDNHCAGNKGMPGSVLFRSEQIIPLRIFSDISMAQQNTDSWDLVEANLYETSSGCWKAKKHSSLILPPAWMRVHQVL